MDNQNPSLHDVKVRRAAIREERQHIETRMRLLTVEDQELAAAERVLARFVKNPPAANGSTGPVPGVPESPGPKATTGLFPNDMTGTGALPYPPPPLPPPPVYPAPKDMTIEEIIAFVLDLNIEPWMTANDIQEQAKAGGKDIPMSSLSPTLSNMKKKEIIERDGLKVALVSRLKNKAATE